MGYAQLIGNEEDERIRLQNQAASHFDADVYHRVLTQYKAPVVLDVGCGNADMIATSHVVGATLLGIDSAQRQVDLATVHHPEGRFTCSSLLYQMAIPAFLDYMETRTNNAPTNTQYREDYEWFANNIDAIRHSFQQDGFLFSMGFMSYTAR